MAGEAFAGIVGNNTMMDSIAMKGSSSVIFILDYNMYVYI